MLDLRAGTYTYSRTRSQLNIVPAARTATLMDSLISGAPTEYLVVAGEGGRDVMELNYICIICVVYYIVH